jgi:nucleotide-binding universal stress UspA family protein
MTNTAVQHPRIVVGVDGSSSSRQALRWALRQAELTRGEVHAVSVWHLPSTTGWDTVLDSIDWAADARHLLDAAVEALAPGDAPPVHRHVIEGHPARALVDLSTDADLLVVGHRGRGAFTGMLMGSVGLHVLAHASCPVVIVRGDQLPGEKATATSTSAAHVLTP